MSGLDQGVTIPEEERGGGGGRGRLSGQLLSVEDAYGARGVSRLSIVDTDRVVVTCCEFSCGQCFLRDSRIRVSVVIEWPWCKKVFSFSRGVCFSSSSSSLFFLSH